MKIVFLCWECMHGIRTGGLAPAATMLAESVAKLGNEVHFITRSNEVKKGVEKINGIDYHYVPAYGNNVVEYCHNLGMEMSRAVARIKESSGEIDVVHGHDWHVFQAVHEIKHGSRFGSPEVVVTYHSTEYGRNGSAFGDWWEFREISAKEWYLSYISDKITAVSNELKNELMWLYGIPHSKIRAVPNGIFAEKFFKNVDAGRVKESYGIHPLAPVILFIGRLVVQKGPDLLLEAVPKVLSYRSDAKFIFVGDGGMKEHLVRRAKELGVEHAVRILGYINDEEQAEILNASDMVCIPSRNEPFGIVLLEAWSAGKAVVACDVGGLRENIENFKDGIKVYPAPESIAWGINYLINDAGGIRHLGENGRKKVLGRFTWKAVAEKMIDVYKEK